LTNEMVHTCSTIGSNVEEIIPRKTHFLMWDLFSIFVIDSTDRNWLLTAREELYKMLAHKDASVLIFANKQDVKDSMNLVKISQFLTLSTIKDHSWHIQGCCALTGAGIWLTVGSWAKPIGHLPAVEMLWFALGAGDLRAGDLKAVILLGYADSSCSSLPSGCKPGSSGSQAMAN
ncbi:ADP-ribosylation factor-like protein 5C, partial [Saguinus oedipus]